MEEVASSDGTVIAFERSGAGPALVVVVGAFCDHASFKPPPDLVDRFTVCTYDRRGRGASGENHPYSVQREMEDLAAVIGATGAGGAYLFGHSSGAVLVLRAAAAGLPIRAAVAYEPPFFVDGSRTPPSANLEQRVREDVAAGRRGEAVRAFLTEVAGVPGELVAMIEGLPMWEGLTNKAHTLPADIAMCGGQRLPVEMLSSIAVPALVLGGGNSPDWFQAAMRATAEAIPGARLRWLDGQDHTAPPKVLAPVLTEFFAGVRPSS